MPDHTVQLLLHDGAVIVTSYCPYQDDLANTFRPCWPWGEDGRPAGVDEAIKVGCVYKDWLEENGLEAITNPMTLTFSYTAHWRSNGDYFDFQTRGLVNADPS